MEKNKLYHTIDRSIAEAENIARHDDRQAYKDDHRKQSRVGTFKLAEIVRFRFSH